MMFDRPGLILYTTIAAIGPLSGVALARAIGPGVDTFIGQIAADAFVALVLSHFLAHDYDEYKRVNEDGPKSAVSPSPARAIPNLNNTPLYEQATPLVKVDVLGIRIKRCCRTLINQHEEGFDIDLREETWIGQFGGRRDNYVYFRDVVMQNAFAKEHPRKNSRFIVIDWDEVKRGANGQLPH